MKTARKLIAAALAAGALMGTTSPAQAAVSEDAVETQGWCDIVPRFCCQNGGGNDTTSTGDARCRPL